MPTGSAKCDSSEPVPLPLPNLLATKNGRLTAFFLLYATEGIPLGFMATAIATQMRRQGLGPAAISAFVGSLFLPWAFKWVAGPIIDTFSSDHYGRRRLWILVMQLGMSVTLLIAMPVNVVTAVEWLTAIILVHNVFAATQDVAIDALAIGVLPEHERGVANGWMFAGQSMGQAVGGAGVLFLAAYVPFTSTYVFVAAAILLVTAFVVLGMKEPRGLVRVTWEGSALAAVGRDIARFVRETWKAFTGSRAALIGVVTSVLPWGAYALSLALQSNLAVELGLTDDRIAILNLWSTVIFALACVTGGWVSDRFGRRLTLGLFVALTIVPTLALAWAMLDARWIIPIDMKAAVRPHPPASLVAMFWVCSLGFSFFQGLHYGVRNALYMDVTTPAVAGTQFTAYMAMSNLVAVYTAWWQGLSIERWGYPATLALDAAAGLVVLLLLPLMRQ